MTWLFLIDSFKIPFLLEARTVIKLSLGLVKQGLAYVTPFWDYCLVFDNPKDLTFENSGKYIPSAMRVMTSACIICFMEISIIYLRQNES